MFWKPCLPERPVTAMRMLACLCLAWAHGAHAQQPSTESKVPVKQRTEASTTSSAAPSQVVIQSNGAPVPFATVLNTNTGQAAVANAQGQVSLSVWGANDTLRIQSMGYEMLSVVPGTQTLLNVELVPTTFEIEEVVVQSNAEVSGALTMASVSHLDRMAVKAPVVTVETTGDLLQNSGQVHLQMSQQGGISPVLRGFEANRVLLVVDGVRMNNAIYRSGHLQNAGTLDPFAIAQTQVVMGPSSVMYGSDALGGVVHFLTRRPAFSQGGFEVDGQVVGQMSTVNGGWAGHAHVSMKQSRWTSLTSISRRSFGDLRMGSNRTHGDSTWGLVPFVVERMEGRDTLISNPDPEVQVPTGYDQWDLQQRMRVRLSSGHVDLNVQHSTTSDVPRFDTYNDEVNGQPKWAEWFYGPQERTLVAATTVFPLPSGPIWTTTASLQKIQESRIKRRFGQDWRVTQLEKLDVWGLNSVLRGHRGEWRWESGLDAQWNDVTSTATGTDIETGRTAPEWTRYADGGSTMGTFGAFGAARRSWGQRTLRTGLRYSHAVVHATFVDSTWMRLPTQQFDQSGGALTGNASWSARWSPQWTSLSSVATGFRHPNVDDVGKVREKNGFVLVPNVDLAPEYLTTAEQGLTWSLKPNSDVLRVQAAAFGSLWNDAIVQVNAALNGDTTLVIDGDTARIQMNQNVARAWVRGARLEVIGKLWPKTSLRSVINWTKGNSLDSSIPLSHIPPTFGVVELSRKGSSTRWSASMHYALAKRADAYGPGATDNLQEALPEGTPRWATFNVEGTVRVTDDLEFRLSALNLLDVHYRTFGSGMSAPGRNLRVTLSTRF